MDNLLLFGNVCYGNNLFLDPKLPSANLFGLFSEFVYEYGLFHEN